MIRLYKLIISLIYYLYYISSYLYLLNLYFFIYYFHYYFFSFRYFISSLLINYFLNLIKLKRFLYRDFLINNFDLLTSFLIIKSTLYSLKIILFIFLLLFNLSKNKFRLNILLSSLSKFD